MKLKAKNIGNKQLCNEIDRLVLEFEKDCFKNESELKKLRPDADKIHSDGFYFFNIAIYRTMILIEFDERGEASVVWAGNHQDYERIFKNNKPTIEKWLKSKNYL